MKEKIKITISEVENFVNKISIAVISETTEDFQNYMDLLLGDNYNKQTSSPLRYITINTNEIKYVCVTKEIHLCGYNFKDVIITDNAYKNDELDNIIHILKVVLSSQPPEKYKEIKEKFEILINKHKQ